MTGLDPKGSQAMRAEAYALGVHEDRAAQIVEAYLAALAHLPEEIAAVDRLRHMERLKMAGRTFIREEEVYELVFDLTLLTRLSRAAPGEGWQTMESAPKDGREVLLRVKTRAGISGGFLVGHYMPGGHCIEDHPPIAAGWYFWNGSAFDLASEPTHWMPLPPAPTQEPGR